VLGFPCNDFGNQEPGTEQEIKTFCETKFGVTFDLFSKVHAKGANQHPLYARLTSYEAKGDISWNFEKFVIDKGGNVVARFSPPTPPNDDKVVSKIQEELAR
jgi:glutathione peroxidase